MSEITVTNHFYSNIIPATSGQIGAIDEEQELMTWHQTSQTILLLIHQ